MAHLPSDRRVAPYVPNMSIKAPPYSDLTEAADWEANHYTAVHLWRRLENPGTNDTHQPAGLSSDPLVSGLSSDLLVSLLTRWYLVSLLTHWSLF